MVEPVMYLAIGFLISMLCGLMILPLVHKPSGTADDAAHRGGDAAVDGGNPGRQGSAPRGVLRCRRGGWS